MPLTFHATMHTFAKTVTLKNDVPIETVQLTIGVTKITTILIYAEADEQKIVTNIFPPKVKPARK